MIRHGRHCLRTIMNLVFDSTIVNGLLFIILPDTSPTYLQFFVVPCYYIIYFGCFICINMLFYIIFGTKLLTQSLVPVPVFFPVLSFAEKEYQTKSKRNKTFVVIFLGPEDIHGAWREGRKSPEGSTSPQGAPQGTPLRLVVASGLL